MSRTTQGAVKLLLASNYDPNVAPSLQPFIDMAEDMVTQTIRLAAARVPSQTITPVTAELIERNLAAHFYCRVDKTYQSKSTGGASGSFTGQTGMSLDATEYGQMACNMDWTGTLSALGKRQTANGVWLGSEPPCPAGQTGMGGPTGIPWYGC